METESKSCNKTGVVIATAVISVLLTLGAITGLDTVVDGKPTQPAADAPGHEGHNHDADNPLWTCGMHPWIVTEEPGLCPICNMELTQLQNKGGTEGGGEREIAYWKDPDDGMKIFAVPEDYTGTGEPVPVYEDQLINGVDISIDPVIEQNMGVRTARVETGPLVSSIRTYGNITFDETRTIHVSLKFSGWIEILHADYTGRQVKKGEPLFEIWSPELFAAQEEYLSAHRSAGAGRNSGLSALLSSARQRLENFGIHETEIQALEQTGKISKTLIIRSPYTGVIISRNVAQGAYVKTGTRVFTISDLSRVWVEASIFEYEMGRLAQGQAASMAIPFLPGKTFNGTVAYIYPYLQKKTRDVVVRLEFDNPGRVLKPDMYANVAIHTTGAALGMRIDSEAVIRSGDSNLVFVAKGNGRFIPRQVVLGQELDQGRVEVISGLAPGDVVVTSGQFLLDSESRLKETIRKMMAPKKVAVAEPPAGADDFFDDMESPEKEDDFFEDMAE